MKKSLLKLLVGIFVFAIGITVNAEDTTNLPNLENGEGSTNGTVSVGSVETPVYNVLINWSDLSFDWTYDSDSADYSWTPSKICSPYEADNVSATGKTIYSDKNCTEIANNVGEESGTPKYYLDSRDSVFFNIEDYSEHGQIVPSVKWNAASNYSYVDAKFTVYEDFCVAVPNENVYDVAVNYGIYSDSTCATETTPSGYVENKYYTFARKPVVLTTEELPDSARISYEEIKKVDGLTLVKRDYRNNYRVDFVLVNKSTPTATPTAGDQIGTITVSVRAK